MSRDDRSTLNPAGAARRRLLRAAGLGALAASVSLDWRKPVVAIGGLPAHAQPSAEGCPVYLEFSFSGGPGGAYSVTFTAGTSTFGSTEWIGSTLSSSTSSASYFQGTSQTVTVGADYSRSNGTVFLTFAATCCTDENGNSPDFFACESGSYGSLFPVTGDDGECYIDD